MIFHSRTLGISGVAGALIFAFANYVFADSIPLIEPIIFGLALLIIGIPHGAVDHIISKGNFHTNPKWFSVPFYLSYTGALALMAVIWYISSTAGFLIFLLMSIYHFGITDVQRLDLPPFRRKILGVFRGFLIISLLILSDIDQSTGLIQQIFQYEVLVPLWIETYYSFAIFSIFFLFATIHVFLFNMDVTSSDVHIYFLDSVILSVLFLISGPVVGFALYFAFWHSLKHVEEYILFRNAPSLLHGIIQFYKDAGAFSLISFFGLGVMIAICLQMGMKTDPMAISLILISALTLPHMIVIEKLYFKQSQV